MLISEYIALLENFIHSHGDLDIETSNFDGARVPASRPKLAYRKILKGRERKDEFAWKDEHRGDPVCRI